MYPITRYWYKNCPLCGHEGELFITKKESGQLYLQCAECFWACDDPAAIADSSKGYVVDIDEYMQRARAAVPTLEEIEAAGWAKYCQHEEVADGPSDFV